MKSLEREDVMKLRNYKIYMKQIKAFAKLCNIRITFVKNMPECGEYRPNRREVLVDKDLPEAVKISTLLHELGHFMDDLRNPLNNFANRFHNDGRNAIDQERHLTMLQKKRILKTEKEAWKNARALASQLSIPLGKWFYQDEKSSLNSYYAIRIRSI